DRHPTAGPAHPRRAHHRAEGAADRDRPGDARDGGRRRDPAR
ncbi:MAG: hypothetical protein AVDCRST_MAG66-4676, partial [uncultured Pseudonocardia sp.]